MKWLAAFLVAGSLVFAYRPYEFVSLGSRATGIGAAGGVVLASPESIVYNPAALSRLTVSELFYEAYATIRIERIETFHYYVSFDSVYFLGYTMPIKDTTWTFAASIATLFQGISDDTKKLWYKQLGVSASFSPLPWLALGITAGPVVGIHNQDGLNGTSVAISAGGSAGVLVNPLPSWLMGLSFIAPVHLQWKSYYGSSVVDEIMPYAVRFGNSYMFTPELTGFFDLEYQGWHLSSWTGDGITEKRDANGAVFVIGKDIHPHFGVEFYDRNAIAKNYGGGIYRLGLFSRSAFTRTGNYESRWQISLGTTIFAGKFIRISGSMLDSWIIEQFVQTGYAAIEEFRFTIEINTDILAGAKATAS
ncbi:MAG: hypothetical protein HZC28_05900 [Spirochaetes bacterium]|nr:hypothetical protein [Spirochaetota bacterium]